MGLTVHSIDSFMMANSGIVCVSDIESLRVILSESIDISTATFIATWSLSETPIHLRNKVWAMVSNCERFLIASQSQHREVDNIEYFRCLKDSHRNINWSTKEIKHLGRNFYLFGVRRHDDRQ